MSHTVVQILVVCWFAVVGPPNVGAAQQIPAQTLKITDGTPVRLTLSEALNSATAQTGDSINFEVAEDVRVGSVTVIPSGATAVGHVVDAEHKKRMGRSGKLNFEVNYLKLANGVNLKVRASAARQGKDKTGAVIVGTVLVSPLFLLMHGHDVNIPKGTAFAAYIDGEHEIAVAGAPMPAVPASSLQPASTPAAAVNDPPAPQSPATGDRAAAASADSAILVLKSNPDGAEVSLDGDYVGSTPSTLKTKPGRHSITIEKPGFKTWQRNLNVTADGSFTVEANLEKSL